MVLNKCSLLVFIYFISFIRQNFVRAVNVYVTTQTAFQSRSQLLQLWETDSFHTTVATNIYIYISWQWSIIGDGSNFTNDQTHYYMNAYYISALCLLTFTDRANRWDCCERVQGHGHNCATLEANLLSICKECSLYFSAEHPVLKNDLMQCVVKKERDLTVNVNHQKHILSLLWACGKN